DSRDRRSTKSRGSDPAAFLVLLHAGESGRPTGWRPGTHGAGPTRSWGCSPARPAIHGDVAREQGQDVLTGRGARRRRQGAASAPSPDGGHTRTGRTSTGPGTR